MRINRETSIIQEKQYKRINHAVLEENSIKGTIKSFRKKHHRKKVHAVSGKKQHRRKIHEVSGKKQHRRKVHAIFRRVSIAEKFMRFSEENSTKKHPCRLSKRVSIEERLMRFWKKTA